MGGRRLQADMLSYGPELQVPLVPLPPLLPLEQRGEGVEEELQLTDVKLSAQDPQLGAVEPKIKQHALRGPTLGSRIGQGSGWS